MTYKGFGLTQTIKAVISAVIILSILVLPMGQVIASSVLLREGSRGPEVTRLQQELKNQSFFNHWRTTDYFGPITRDAVIRFQRARGLSPDGIVGSKTRASLYGNQTSGGSGYTTLRFGMRGPDVVKLQNALKQKGHFWANATGYYGQITQNAVIAFQRAAGISIDGIAGPQTQRVLYGQSSVATPTTATVSRANSTKAREEIYWLGRIIFAESRGESYQGQVAVGNVVMNRVKSSIFPNSVYGVIFEYTGSVPQFSPVQDGSIYNTPSSQSMKAAEEAYNGAKPVGNALYFFNPSKAAGSWIVNNRRYMTTIGNHAFYY